MSTHIAAEPGQVAPLVLLAGDPLRARWIAETYLDAATCYSERRGMFGYTGAYRGVPVSVQGSGWACRPCRSASPSCSPTTTCRQSCGSAPAVASPPTWDCMT